MKKIAILIIVLFTIISCSYKNKLVMYDKSNYIKINGVEYIQANYNNTNELYPELDIQLHIVNNTKGCIYVFSTVLENKNMLYSKLNHRQKSNILKFNSFYKNYINDADYSGIKKFNFIKIEKGDSLLINFDKKKIPTNIDEIELTYYFFSEIKGGIHLIDLKKNIIKKATVRGSF